MLTIPLPTRSPLGMAWVDFSKSAIRCALKRGLARQTIALKRPLLAAVDAGVVTILPHAAKARLIEDGADHYSPAVQPGVWAGRADLSDPEPEWNLSCFDTTARVSVFWRRTFLAPDLMRLSVWLRWKADPALSVR